MLHEVNSMKINNFFSNFNNYINVKKTSASETTDQTSQKTQADTPKDNQVKSNSQTEFTPYEEKIIQDLKVRDQEVRDHEMAHVAAGGAYVKRGANYQYEKGPDGLLYAVAGDVLIDSSAIAGNPEATIKKMDTIRAAALAPANPSGPDRAVASQATTVKIKAQEELIMLQLKKSQIQKSEKSYGSYEEAAEKSQNSGSNINIYA